MNWSYGSQHVVQEPIEVLLELAWAMFKRNFVIVYKVEIFQEPQRTEGSRQQGPNHDLVQAGKQCDLPVDWFKLTTISNINRFFCIFYL